MRKIKFRAKTLFDGREIVGDLQHDGGQQLIVTETCREVIKPETVEQLAYVDSDGKEYFENDIYEQGGKRYRVMLVLKGALINEND